MTSYVVDCSGKGKISPSLECLYINKQIRVTLLYVDGLTQLEAEQTMTIKIFGINNPKSLQKSESFKFQTRSSQFTYIYSDSQILPIIIKNKKANIIQSASIDLTNDLLGKETNFNIKFLGTNSIPVNGIIRVIIPDVFEFVADELTCQGLKNLHGNLDCQSSVNNTNNITIQTHIDRENLKPEEREFQINGFKNPEEPKFEQSF